MVCCFSSEKGIGGLYFLRNIEKNCLTVGQTYKCSKNDKILLDADQTYWKPSNLRIGISDCAWTVLIIAYYKYLKTIYWL